MAGGRRRHTLRRRVLTATLVVTTAAIVVFGVPLAFFVTRIERERVVLRLERTASQLIAQVPDEQLTRGQVSLPHPLPDATGERRTAVGVYTAQGRRLSGAGPTDSRLVSQAATAGREVSGNEAGEVVVAEPLRLDRPGTAVVRVAVPDAVVTEDITESIEWMAALAAAVLGLTAAVSVALARRLARPLESLATRAQQLGDGDFAVHAEPADTTEIDAVGGALNATAGRLRALIERERAFTANASHQMRTPLTALRLTLETAPLVPARPLEELCTEALRDVDRLEETVKHLLAVARDADLPASEVELSDVFSEAERRWRDPFRRAGRRLVVQEFDEALRVRASATGLSHVLDVLVDNALQHGAGVVTVALVEGIGHVEISVQDEGPGVVSDDADVFERRQDSARGHGIGLALARSLVEADGGRLELTDPGPRPMFTITLATVRASDQETASPEGAFR